MLYTVGRITPWLASTDEKGCGIIVINQLDPSYKSPFDLLKEQSENYTDHDQLFKQLIEIFFEEFIEAFFPHLHEAIDFTETAFLSEELFTDFHDGDKKVADLVVQVKAKDTDAYILVHVEPQSSRESNFHQRMFEYFALIAIRTKKIVYPIAIFSYEDRWEKNAYHMEFADLQMLMFRYRTLHLRKQNWRTFIKQDNPVAGALLSKMNYKEEEKVQVKLEFFKILTRLKLDREKTSFLLGFFERYLVLNEAEEDVFMKDARKLDNANEILELPISYEERGKKIGEEIGEARGLKKGRELGKVEGLEEGAEKSMKRVARRLLSKGSDIEFIADATELSVEEIKRLKSER